MSTNLICFFTHANLGHCDTDVVPLVCQAASIYIINDWMMPVKGIAVVFGHYNADGNGRVTKYRIPKGFTCQNLDMYDIFQFFFGQHESNPNTMN